MQPASNLLLLPSGTNSRTWADMSYVHTSLYFENHDSVHDDVVQNVTQRV